jgi:hypothetical protein
MEYVYVYMCTYVCLYICNMTCFVSLCRAFMRMSVSIVWKLFLWEALLVGSCSYGKLFLWEAVLMGSFACGKCFVRLARGGVVVWAKSAIPMLLDRYLDGYVAP